MTIGLPTYGLLCPFCFFFLSLGHPWLICFLWASSSLLLTLYSHGLLLTSLDFPGPITSFSFLGFMGLPLILYFLCLHCFWACSGPSSLFYIIYCPWVCYFSLLRLFKAYLPPQGTICLFHEPVIHHSCRLGLMALLLVCQTFVALVTRLFAFHLDPQK